MGLTLWYLQKGQYYIIITEFSWFITVFFHDFRDSITLLLLYVLDLKNYFLFSWFNWKYIGYQVFVLPDDTLWQYEEA